MASILPPRIEKIITLFARLPGVGEKTAQRYALYLLGAEPSMVRTLGEELLHLPDAVRPCDRCGNVAEVAADGQAICSICADPRRHTGLLCIVARPADLFAIERSGTMRGLYFVLGRLLSPLEGIGPDELPLAALARRIHEDKIEEVIVATPPSVDGEATALLLKREIAPLGISMTRIASGVPHGGDLEFADPITMGRAFAGRQRM